MHPRKELQHQIVVAAVKSGMTKTDVADKFGLSRTTIYNILERVKTDSPLISNFKAVRAEINALNQIKRQEKQDEILDSITLKEIQTSDLKTKMAALNILGLDKNREYLAERLENDESTENVAVIVMAIKDAKRRMEEDGS